ncbi:MAG: phospholipase D-like domain-containing protein [Micropruina glycogenica]
MRARPLAHRSKPFYKATLARLDAIGASWHLVAGAAAQGQVHLARPAQPPQAAGGRRPVAFTGSQNLTDDTYNLRRGLHWVDVMVRVEGPVVSNLNAVFLGDWYSESGEVLTDEVDLFSTRSGPSDLDCQIVPSGPGFEFQNNLKLFVGLLYAAQERIIIVSPYFIPNEALLLAITTACQRGLRVELFVCEEGDQAMVFHAQRSYYEALLRAGVVIWQYRKPFILHTKSMTIDDEVAIIGTKQHGHAFVRPQPRAHHAGARRRLRRTAARGRAVSGRLAPTHPGRVAEAALRSTVLDNLARLTSALQ